MTLNTVKTITLALGILVVLNLFIGMGIRTFYPGPAFENFCPVGGEEITSQATCEQEGGKWITSIDKDLVGPRALPLFQEEGRFQAFCDEQYTCRQVFDDVEDERRRNIFIVWVVVGAAALLVGQRINTSAAVSSGLTFGGVLAFIIGAAGYWSDMDEVLRFIILGAVLAVLIWIGYKKSR